MSRKFFLPILISFAILWGAANPPAYTQAKTMGDLIGLADRRENLGYEFRNDLLHGDLDRAEVSFEEMLHCEREGGVNQFAPPSFLPGTINVFTQLGIDTVSDRVQRAQTELSKLERHGIRTVSEQVQQAVLLFLVGKYKRCAEICDLICQKSKHERISAVDAASTYLLLKRLSQSQCVGFERQIIERATSDVLKATAHVQEAESIRGASDEIRNLRLVDPPRARLLILACVKRAARENKLLEVTGFWQPLFYSDPDLAGDLLATWALRVNKPDGAMTWLGKLAFDSGLAALHGARYLDEVAKSYRCY